MGCASSSAADDRKILEARQLQTASNGTTQLTTTAAGTKGPVLTDQEILARIESCDASQPTVLGDIKARYAWVSQRGYYPDAPNKENQDAFSVLNEFGKDPNWHFFGVYDGHGKDGHHCARFTRDNLPRVIADKLDKLTEKSKSHASIKQAITLSHLLTNSALHTNNTVDDSLSGTTSITVFFDGKRMYVNNVGDSRAIIVSLQPDGRLVAKPLSSDQTPYRKDERERIKKYGARILSMDQIDGIEPEHENWGDLNLGEDIDEGGDPPRVWHPHQGYPGTAFTRSLGDRLAKELGVIAEPEILVRELTESDRYLIIASDGVFEFLTNQMVADMCARVHDPFEAAKVIVEAAYNLWLQYEVRTDDITALVVFLDQDSPVTAVAAGAPGSPPGSEVARPSSPSALSSPGTNTNSGSGAAILQQEISESRPVRRSLSKEKKKNIIHSQSIEDAPDDEDSKDEEIGKLVIPKSEEDKMAIISAIKSNFLFQHLNSTQRQTVVDLMQPLVVTPGQWVIRQGDQGDRFYVVDSGRYEVRVRAPNTEDPTGGSVVHIYEGSEESHPGFGELSLMYGKPRAASVIALTDGKLWALNRNIFKKVVMRSMDIRKDIIRVLKNVELLKCLNLQQKQRLADLLCEEIHPAGSYIIRQGEVGENFYLLVTGSCECTIKMPGDDGVMKEVTVMNLKDNSYFGEKALLSNQPRAANVIAKTETKVLYIGKHAFEEVLGPLATIIDEDRRRREEASLAAMKYKGPSRLSDIKLLGVSVGDTVSPLLVGAFNNTDAKRPCNISVRSFILSEVAKQSLKKSVMSYLDAAKAISASPVINPFLPRILGTSYEPNTNALHVYTNAPIVCDLYSLVMSQGKVDGGTVSNGANSPTIAVTSVPVPAETITFIVGCIVSGLTILHDLGIIYRGVQPESVYIDAKGLVLLTDFRLCKVGAVDGRTYTICGAADYLAPEQISQRGHGTAVDLWALGVLIYELAVGGHPFSSPSEVATYSKISSFGSRAFPSLPFPDTVATDVKSIINQLIAPTPEARLGVGTGGFAALRKHSLFRNIDLGRLDRMASPLQAFANQELQGIISEGTDDALFEQFNQEYTGDDWSVAADLNS